MTTQATEALGHRADALARAEHELEDLSREILERYEEVNVFYRLNEFFRDMFDEREILSRLLSEASNAARASGGWLALPGGDGAAPVPAAAVGSGHERATSRSGRELIDRAFAENRTLAVDARGSAAGPGTSMMAVPLAGKRGPIGVLLLERGGRSEPFRSGELRLVAAVAAHGASVVENRRLAHAMQQTERVRGEIETARRIQAGLLPARDPEVRGLDIAGICRPAQDVGGDYFGYAHMAPGVYGIVIADVSGHSIGAAIGMVMTRCLLQSEAHRDTSPSRVLARVNELLCRDLTDPGMFVTCFLAVYDETTGMLSYANAGHNPPLLHRAHSGILEDLPDASLGLGIDSTASYEERTRALGSGDVLLMYTDGATEARDGSGEMFGLDRLRAALRDVSAMPAREAVESIVERITRWRGSPLFDDDLTLVVARKEKA